MPLYEFRIRSQGATIWIVENYCRDDIDALEKAETDFGVKVWREGCPVAPSENKQTQRVMTTNGVRMAATSERRRAGG